MRSRRVGIVAAVVVLASFFALGRVGAPSPVAPDVARGQHLATALAGCAECHGASYAGGRAFVRAGQTVYASNLTGGRGGVGAYSDADLRRAIRLGIAPDGTRLRVMPSSEYAVMTDADVDDLIAFLRTVPPVDHTIIRTGAVPAAPAQTQAAPDASPQRAVTGGAYLVTIAGCTNCHGANLAGGEHFGPIVAPNISHAGIGNWSSADFQTALRTGKTPDGRMLAPIMPWASIGRMTDDELRTIYDLLEAQSATAANAN